jgi:CarD family transcriptional regulator
MAAARAKTDATKVAPKAATTTAAPQVAKSATAKPAAKVGTSNGAAPQAPEARVAAAATVAAPAPQPAPARSMAQAVAKPMAMKTSAPASPKDIAARAAASAAAATNAAAMAAARKPVSSRHGFKTNEYIVYPAHGVGRIVGIEEQEIAGMSLELFVITFDKDKLTLRVPTGKLQSVGMRKLAEEPVVKKAMETLKGRARVKRTMWSRRAQEYETKINSGDLVSIAEVVRDLYRSEAQPEQSYSERQLYEAALDRMAREIAAVERLDERGAVQRIVEVLAKSAKGRRAAAEGAEAVESEPESAAEFKAA